MIIESLEELLKQILEKLNYEEKAKIIKSNRPDLCDYQFDGVFKLASIYHKNPIEIGEEVVGKINNLDNFNDYFKEVTFVKPGFVNIKISDKLINELLTKMNEDSKFNIEQNDDDKNLENMHGALMDILIVLKIIIKNKIETLIIPIMPNSSDIIENIKSVCGSGK